MKPGVMKAVVAAISCGVLAGCATTVDMGGPLGHYRYHYDAGVAYGTSPTVIYHDGVTYREPAVVYREPAVTYRAPAYRAPAVVYYRYPAATTFSYYDHKR